MQCAARHIPGGKMLEDSFANHRRVLAPISAVGSACGFPGKITTPRLDQFTREASGIWSRIPNGFGFKAKIQDSACSINSAP
ncbi:hypothetical protein N658DRAFT_129574 [Parathielavia hyrcaniae]|uniref:Uncharacterized protein n=1 Tax=Parathielavia hyrcaniae TaxID=113614 RepID=A0AAN6QA31_9PEZI|nr:hypothetical protein N658DRAFT_129574 [Parathielavia hyrcaniae]